MNSLTENIFGWNSVNDWQDSRRIRIVSHYASDKVILPQFFKYGAISKAHPCKADVLDGVWSKFLGRGGGGVVDGEWGSSEGCLKWGGGGWEVINLILLGGRGIPPPSCFSSTILKRLKAMKLKLCDFKDTCLKHILQVISGCYILRCYHSNKITKDTLQNLTQ